MHASLRVESPRRSTFGVESGSLPTSQPQCALPPLSVRGPGAVKSETSHWRAGLGSSWPTRATVWPEGPQPTGPRHQRQNGSRNTRPPLGRIASWGVVTLRATVSSSYAPPTCGEIAAVHLRPCPLVTGKDLLHLIRGELVPLDMEDIVIIPLKPGNHHDSIVSSCIYEPLQCSSPHQPSRCHKVCSLRFLCSLCVSALNLIFRTPVLTTFSGASC